MITIDFIAIGNELLNGKVQDSNGAALAKILHQNNYKLGQIHIIADDEKYLKKTLELASSHSDAVIISGGLGPTPDDKTKMMLAHFFKKEITLSELALKKVKNIYERRAKIYDRDKFHYHFIPKDFELLDNPIGFAPGLVLETKTHITFATPGVPSEFRAMVEQEIIPKLNQKFSQENLCKHFIARTWKIPESRIFKELAPTLWDDLANYGEVSSLPHLFGVDIGVALKGSSEEIAEKEKKCLSLIENSSIHSYVWRIGHKSLAETIVLEASEKSLTIGFAESCTGGLCASMITDVSGSSQVFWGSVVSYANEVKEKSLLVQNETLKKFGAVSEQTAFEMAKGARVQLEVDITVTTTGIAGPLGGSPEKPVGTVGIGVSTKSETKSKLYYFTGNREILKQRFANKALMSMLETIREL